MKEFKIKQMTKEEFLLKYNLTKEQGENYFTGGHAVSEMGNLMNTSQNETYILIEDKLYKEFQVDKDKTTKENLLSQGEVQKIEKLNEEFRDALISLREYLYHGGRGLNSDKARAVRLTMNNCVNEAKDILNTNNIKDIDQLKEVSHKHFIAEFLEGLFGNEIYDFEDHIDCGL